MKTINNYAELVKAQHALNKTLAPVETDLTGASQTYAKGAKFIYNGIMYQAKIDIAQGDALVLNTNYEAADDVETQIANEAATRSEMGAKNVLPFTMENIKAINTNGTWNGNSYTYNGITYVVSEDGVIEVSGTNNSGTNSVFYLVITESGPQFNFKLGRYKLNGCPAGGSDPTYSWYVAKTGQYNSDFGSGATFEVTSETDSYWSLISVKTGTALEGTKTFKPMVWLASDSDATFHPYAKTNKELTDDVSSLNTAIANKANTTDVATADNATRTMIAPIETSPSANAYSVGDFLIYNSVLYKVKASIAATDALVVDTNIEVANDLETQIKAKQDALTIDATPTSASTNPVQSGGTYDFVSNKHKVTTKTVSTSGWTTDTTSQSGTTLYKKSISCSHVYVDSPTVDIGADSGSVLPTTAQQTAYDLLQYVTVDGTTLYLYASATPTDAFYINVEGVD